MLSTQWAEIQSRYRRFLRSVGQQTLAAEEVISPTLQLEQLWRPPWRSEPRAWATGLAVGGAAGAGNRNMVSVELNLTAQLGGAALVLGAYIHARSRLVAASVTEAVAWIGAASNTGNGAVNLEPVINPGTPNSLPVRCGQDITGTTPANSTEIARRPIWDTTVGLQLGAYFDFVETPVVLVDPAVFQLTVNPALWLSIDVNDVGGVDSVDVYGSFWGVYFNQYPAR